MGSVDGNVSVRTILHGICFRRWRGVSSFQRIRGARQCSEVFLQ